MADSAGLRKRLSFLFTLERSLKRATTPFEERFYFDGIKGLFRTLRKIGLIAATDIKSLPLTTPRLQVARSLIVIMRKALRNRIGELAELKKIKILDLPSRDAKKAPLLPARKARGMRRYMHLIKELPAR